MFHVFPVMQQLHEMLCYLNEAIRLKETQQIYRDLQDALEETESFTNLNPESLINLNVSAHRVLVSD